MASSPVLSSTEVQSIWYCLSYSSLLAKQKISMSWMIGDMQSVSMGHMSSISLAHITRITLPIKMGLTRGI